MWALGAPEKFDRCVELFDCWVFAFCVVSSFVIAFVAVVLVARLRYFDQNVLMPFDIERGIECW